ncbi:MULTISPECIES: DUF4153 domain-containing protein [unclassified Aurantimonas]|uniref:DUF4153 domain-containing protein n=1 Tax=unclassified Aurantimonas TaxID=2638230 RepID=UPI002E175318|nr:hypothetical protein [Aurantimonas sp. A3-2-R12]
MTQSLAEGAGSAAIRFPVATLLVVAIAIISNLAVRNVYLPNEADFVWLVVALYGAAASSVVAAIFAEARRSPVSIRLVSPIATASFVGLVIWFGPELGVTAPPLILAATLAVPLAPYLGRHDTRHFWVFTLWTVAGVTLAFLSVLLFVLGLSAILEMIRFLLDVGLPDDAYEHIYVTAFALVGPLFSLGRIPRDFDDAMPVTGDDRLISGVRILIDWVAAPLVLATAIVLHLYAAKILVTIEVPKNEIGWIVSLFAFLLLSLRVASDPFIAGGAWPTRLLARIWAFVLLVPLALLFYAVSLRVAAEGVTLERYYLALAAVAAVIVIVLEAVPRARGDIRWMAAVPIVLLALSSFGPWGAASTVGRSQTSLIVTEFGWSDEMVGSGIPAADRPANAQARLRSRLYALEEAGELDRILPYLDPEAAAHYAEAKRGSPGTEIDMVFAELGLAAPSQLSEFRSFTANAGTAVDLAGFDRALSERAVAAAEDDGGGGRVIPARPGDIALAVSGTALTIRIGAVADRVDLADAIAALPETVFATDPDRLAPVVVDVTSARGRRIRMALRQLSLSGDTGAILSATLALYYRSADWPAEAAEAPDGAAPETSLGGGGDRIEPKPRGIVGEGAR